MKSRFTLRIARFIFLGMAIIPIVLKTRAFPARGPMELLLLSDQ